MLSSERSGGELRLLLCAPQLKLLLVQRLPLLIDSKQSELFRRRR